jgi:hypothetical protein
MSVYSDPETMVSTPLGIIQLNFHELWRPASPLTSRKMFSFYTLAVFTPVCSDPETVVSSPLVILFS